MDDVTNYMNNFGKPLPEQEFTIKVNYAELQAIVGLAQNPHDAYQQNLQLMDQAENIFTQGRAIIDYAEARENKLDKQKRKTVHRMLDGLNQD